MDPAVIRARGEADQSLETQVDNIVTNIAKQRFRAKKNSTEIIHIINLLRVRPVDRLYGIEIFKQKVLELNKKLQNDQLFDRTIDLRLIRFINYSPNSI